MESDMPAAYLAIKDDPDVLLCEIILAAHRFAMIARISMRYYEGGPFPTTTLALAEIRQASTRPGISDIAPASPEAPLIRNILSAIQEVLASEKAAKGRDRTVSPEAISRLLGTLEEPEIASCRPPAGRRFIEVRAKLWSAAGKTPPRDPGAQPAPG